jgi:hypothetical protein
MTLGGVIVGGVIAASAFSLWRLLRAPKNAVGVICVACRHRYAKDTVAIHQDERLEDLTWDCAKCNQVNLYRPNL